MLEAKSSLSRLVEALEQGEEQEIIIARNGRPAAKLVPNENQRRRSTAQTDWGGKRELSSASQYRSAQRRNSQTLSRRALLNLLLGTHVALWAITDDERLSAMARELIQSPRAMQSGLVP